MYDIVVAWSEDLKASGMAMFRISVILLLVLAAGCASSNEKAAAFCDSHGFVRGTLEYAHCLETAKGS